jgi:uncharacterized protein YqjF (DUF2071 family)
MKPFLTAEWNYLAMLNYQIDPEILLPLIPAGTELDSWNNKYFVSMVGFLFLKTRVLGFPIPFHRDFEEVNLRFYVRRVVPGECRRGVVFVKEIVPKWTIAAIARAAYNEKYISLSMRHSIDSGKQPAIRYDWRWQNEWNSLSLIAKEHSFLPEQGSQEEFITEHYWGYASQRDGGAIEYRVEHPRWEVREASEASLQCDVETLYGSRFVPALSSSPTSAFLAHGSAIAVFPGNRIHKVS